MRAYRTYIILTILITIGLFVKLNGCSYEDGIVDISSDMIEHTSNLRAGSEMEYFAGEVSTYLILRSTGIDLTGGDCPVITMTGDISNGSIIVNYGNVACINSAKNIRRSGKYIINFQIDTNGSYVSINSSIVFENYKIYKVNNAIDTTDYVLVTGNTYVNGNRISNTSFRFSWTIKNNLSNKNANKSLDLYAETQVNYNDLYNIADDVLYIVSSGEIIDSVNNRTVIFAIDNNKNMQIWSWCKFPIRGIVYLSGGITPGRAEFDPNDGNCDEILYLTVGNFTKSIKYESIDF